MFKIRNLLILLLVLLASQVFAGYKTQNVFVLIMDGARYCDTFGTPENIPHIWNDLRPKGVIYTNFYNSTGHLGTTATHPGHSIISSGTWETCWNDGPRVTRPTFFDYYRQEKHVPKEKTWAVFGKGRYGWHEYSSFPVYSDRFKPVYETGLGESFEGDTRVRNRVIEAMRTYYPSLFFVNFGNTDATGHQGVFEKHIEAIKHCDQMIWNIWQEVQSDPVYKNKTTFIITCDHGRHDDNHGGFQHHGCGCDGCQHVMLMIVGPDTKKGVQINREVSFVDIAPTIGEFLEFQTPLVQGKVLSGCFENYAKINKLQALTATSRRAVELEKLSQRDLVKVVAEKLKKELNNSNIEWNFRTKIALSGLLSASDLKQNISYKEFVENRISHSFNKEILPYVRAQLFLADEKQMDSVADKLMDKIKDGDLCDQTPEYAVFLSQFSEHKDYAAKVLIHYLEERRKRFGKLYGDWRYTPELAYHVSLAALSNKSNHRLQIESLFAAANCFANISEPGDICNDPADSCLMLYILGRTQAIPWWREMPRGMQFWDRIPLTGTLALIKEKGLEEILAKELTHSDPPLIAPPAQVFLRDAALKGKVGCEHSVDLLKYYIDSQGNWVRKDAMLSRDQVLASGAYLLLNSEGFKKSLNAGKVSPNYGH